MKKILSLFAFLFLFVAITCEDEPLDDGIEQQQQNSSCQQAAVETAEAALAFTNAIDGNYTELCTNYKNALEALIEACGDTDGSIQQTINALGDCTNIETVDECQAAAIASNLAQINFENAPEENYTDFCNAYVLALGNQILECDDPDGSIQAIIDGLDDCANNQTNDCESATQEVETAQTAFENADNDNYTELCNTYVSALQNQISVCGDADGSIQAIIDDLGDCSVPTTYAIGDIGPGGGYVFYVSNGGLNGLEVAPLETEFLTQWGCYNMQISGTSSDFGTGQSNTNTILDFHNNINFYNNPEQCQQNVPPVGVIQSTGDVAAKNCDDLVFGGQDDWYLPSIDELSLIYDNLISQDLGDFTDGEAYCSSTDDNSQALNMYVLFSSSGSASSQGKYNLWAHRAVRNF